MHGEGAFSHVIVRSCQAVSHSESETSVAVGSTTLSGSALPSLEKTACERSRVVEFPSDEIFIFEESCKYFSLKFLESLD